MRTWLGSFLVWIGFWASAERDHRSPWVRGRASDGLQIIMCPQNYGALSKIAGVAGRDASVELTGLARSRLQFSDQQVILGEELSMKAAERECCSF